jgi:hypothetical protein
MNENKRISDKKSVVISVFIIIAGFAAVFFVSDFIEKNRPPLPENYADSDLALQGAKLKNYSLGFNGLLADFYWMQSLQYLGKKILDNKTERVDIENLRPLNPRLLYPLLDNATDLDPRFTEVYAYGAIVLPTIDNEQAIRLAEKGIRNNPDEWKLYQHLGFIYWKLGDYEKASEVYAKGSQIQGAPPFMKMMSAQMKTDGGSRETSREIYRQMFEESEDTQVKENARLRLLELDSLDERDAIRAALQTFREKNNRCAANWREIFPLLKNVRLPNGKDFLIDEAANIVDPTGAAYILDKEKCDVSLDFKKTKLPF